jgi:hypothetical protein
VGPQVNPASASQVRIAQHGWPVAPHAWQVVPAMPIPKAQARPELHVPSVVPPPPQQASPEAPHIWQVAPLPKPLQPRPLLHMSPAQHA